MRKIKKKKIIIIGGGMSAICIAMSLKKNNIDNFIILEKGSESKHGTWGINRYPGSGCDVPSHLYSFSNELNPNWSNKYPLQSEIFQYLNNLKTKYQLHKHYYYHHQVIACKWSLNKWILHVKKGSIYQNTEIILMKCNILISAVGQLNIPSYSTLNYKKFKKSFL